LDWLLLSSIRPGILAREELKRGRLAPRTSDSAPRRRGDPSPPMRGSLTFRPCSVGTRHYPFDQTKPGSFETKIFQAPSVGPPVGDPNQTGVERPHWYFIIQSAFVFQVELKRGLGEKPGCSEIRLTPNLAPLSYLIYISHLTPAYPHECRVKLSIGIAFAFFYGRQGPPPPGRAGLSRGDADGDFRRGITSLG
jgi:hypothetical protein